MNSVQEMLDEAESEHVAYTEFMHQYQKDDRLYCFFEGDDDIKYYRVRIEAQTGRAIEGFTCYGVDKLKRIKQLVEEKLEYKNALILYFIDKDFTSQITTENMYVTPVYSIENFYSNRQTLERILTDEFKISKLSHDFNICIQLFEKLQNEFHNKLLVFNAWLACQSDLRIQTGQIKRLNITDTVKNYFDDKTIVASNLTSVRDYAELNDIEMIENVIFKEVDKIDHEILEAKINDFSQQIFDEVFRGKFELKFFISFIKKLINLISNAKTTILSKKYKYKLQLNPENEMSILSQYALTPLCLPVFLGSFHK